MTKRANSKILLGLLTAGTTLSVAAAAFAQAPAPEGGAQVLEKYPFCTHFPGFIYDACEHAAGGGIWMLPIAACFFFMLVIGIERVISVFMNASVNKEGFVAQLTTLIVSGNLQQAIKFVTGQKPTPLSNVVKAGLMKVNKSDAEVQSALDEATLRELPKLEKRTGYLAMIGNVAMLCGLLGTISGLIKCFASVAKPGVDPALKSQVLADGIAEAMNCTAFGLITAIPALITFSIINGKTQHLIDDINETAVAVLNLVVANRDKLRV